MPDPPKKAELKGCRRFPCRRHLSRHPSLRK
jgi:hypothetical protein